MAASALLRPDHPPLQTGALSLLLSGTVAVSVYLFTVMVRPETF